MTKRKYQPARPSTSWDNEQLESQDEERKQRAANKVANDEFVALMLEHHSSRETPLVTNEAS